MLNSIQSHQIFVQLDALQVELQCNSDMLKFICNNLNMVIGNLVKQLNNREQQYKNLKYDFIANFQQKMISKLNMIIVNLNNYNCELIEKLQKIEANIQNIQKIKKQNITRLTNIYLPYKQSEQCFNQSKDRLKNLYIQIQQQRIPLINRYKTKMIQYIDQNSNIVYNQQIKFGDTIKNILKSHQSNRLNKWIQTEKFQREKNKIIQQVKKQFIVVKSNIQEILEFEQIFNSPEFYHECKQENRQVQDLQKFFEIQQKININNQIIKQQDQSEFYSFKSKFQINRQPNQQQQ